MGVLNLKKNNLMQILALLYFFGPQNNVVLEQNIRVLEKTISAIDSILFRFIWKNKMEYIKRKTMIRTYADGGFNAIDFTTLNQAFKITWLKNA